MKFFNEGCAIGEIIIEENLSFRCRDMSSKGANGGICVESFLYTKVLGNSYIATCKQTLHFHIFLLFT